MPPPVALISLLGCLSLVAAQGWFAGPRVDCGFVGIDENECQRRGCLWAPAAFEGGPHLDLPWCFTPNDDPSTYAVAASGTNEGPLDAVLALQQGTMAELGADVRRLRATAREVAPGVLRFRLADADAPRWEIPPWMYPGDSIAGGGGGYRPAVPGTAEDATLHIEWGLAPFSLRVHRRDAPSSAPLFDSTGLRLIFKPQYIEISTWMAPNVTLYGAGQRASATLHLRRNGAPRPLWARDLGPTFQEANSYGAHPFALALDPGGTAWGLYLHNSNAMEIVPAPDRLSWRLTGGVVDMFVLGGPTPAAVLEQLTAVAGRPAMPPLWALGWQASRYGWRSLEVVEGVVANYSAAGIPLEAVYFDIDHMDRWKDFTFDPERYALPAVQRFVAGLDAKGQKWVPIVDPGIKVEPGYEPYETGRATAPGVFVGGAGGGAAYLGWVWPGPTYFPDFLSPNGRAFFERELAALHAAVGWHGLWIDMNEASSFCTGDVCVLPTDETSGSTANPAPWECQLDCSHDLRPALNASHRALVDPPFKIANALSQGQSLGTNTMSVLATHAASASGSAQLSTVLQYDAHNLYGLAEARTAASAAAATTGKRPFVLSRSTFVGAGASAGSWTGDNAASWGDLSISIPGVLSLGLVGIPLAGADVCGFHGDAQEATCAAWVAAAALTYPLARSHNAIEAAPQEPYLWPSVAAAARRTLSLRASLLPVWYTAFRTAAESGAPVARPVWFQFPTDTAAHALDSQVMVGDAVMVAPVLSPGGGALKMHFPGGQTWYDAWEEEAPVDAVAGAVETEVPVPADAAPVYLAGGSILPMFDFGGASALPMTTTEARRAPLKLVVALRRPEVEGGGAAARQAAAGTLYTDDGESLEIGRSHCNFLKFELEVGPAGASGQRAGALRVASEAPPSFQISQTNDSCGGFAAPKLLRVKVLGWQRPVEGGSVRLEARTPVGSVAAKVLDIPVLPASSGRTHMEFVMPEGALELNFPIDLSFTWTSAASAAAVLGGLGQGAAVAVA